MKATTILFVIFFVFCADAVDKYKLKQVLIISRHNVRTPLSKDLSRMTPKTWPHWKEKSGYLTPRGALLEGYMGEYFSQWLFKEGILPEGCPTEKDFYVYANTKQRTVASANAFVEKAFPECNITVHFNNTTNMDPLFNPIIHNTTEIFKQIALEEMEQLLKSLQLNNSYEYLENVLDYRDSDNCRIGLKCNLTIDKNIIKFAVGVKPNVLGPLKIGNSVTDAFIMEYYEGLNNVAWGQLDKMEQWHIIMNISKGYHNVIFNTTLVARDIAEPLMKYMSDLFLSKNASKVTLLMGHDANMYTLLNGMRFKSYSLRNQHEITPVGGKIVFQRWFDIQNGRDLLKVQYIYMSSHQMRNAVELSLVSPPEFSLLEMKDCPVDNKGFCLWDDFEKILKNL